MVGIHWSINPLIIVIDELSHAASSPDLPVDTVRRASPQCDPWPEWWYGVLGMTVEAVSVRTEIYDEYKQEIWKAGQ